MLSLPPGPGHRIVRQPVKCAETSLQARQTRLIARLDNPRTDFDDTHLVPAPVLERGGGADDALQFLGILELEAFLVTSGDDRFRGGVSHVGADEGAARPFGYQRDRPSAALPPLDARLHVEVPDFPRIVDFGCLFALHHEHLPLVGPTGCLVRQTHCFIDQLVWRPHVHETMRH